MIEQPYPYFDLKSPTHYFFESIGVNGSVYKIVEFSLQRNGNWNLGFGDLIEGRINDTVVTNKRCTKSHWNGC